MLMAELASAEAPVVTLHITRGSCYSAWLLQTPSSRLLFVSFVAGFSYCIPVLLQASVAPCLAAEVSYFHVLMLQAVVHVL